MTFDELKKEAQRQGYSLIKRKEPIVRLLPCPCGRKHLSIWGSLYPSLGIKREYLVACPKCGNGEDNEWKPTEKEARELWNRTVEQNAAVE